MLTLADLLLLADLFDLDPQAIPAAEACRIIGNHVWS